MAVLLLLVVPPTAVCVCGWCCKHEERGGSWGHLETTLAFCWLTKRCGCCREAVKDLEDRRLKEFVCV